MLTRRALVAAGGLSCLPTTWGTGAVRGPESVEFEVPAGACDAHTHVVGDPIEFPMSEDRAYTPPPATVDQLELVLRRLQLDRVVIVTPTVYGNDNAVTLAALQRLGPARARGIALIDENTSPRMLDALERAQISGFRVFLSSAHGRDRGLSARRLEQAIALAAARGWHLQISSPPDVTAALSAQLSSCPVPVVLEYFGWASSVDQEGFDAILSLVKSSRVYVKLAEPYRVSKQPPDYPDLVPVIVALLAANPEQVVWGSGWPHVDSTSRSGRERLQVAPNLNVDPGHLLNLLARCVPNAATRYKILVENPARLYGF
jgi:predicted TIM-barrel fold metal-dependent hydrolase